MVRASAGRRRGQARANPSTRPWTSRVIEIAWLAGLLSVVLAFDGGGRVAFTEQPKQIALHLAAVVIAITWAIELALHSDRFSSLPPLRTWLGKSPSRWAVISVAIFAAVAVLSTATSRAPEVSLWGRNYNGLGYELYSFLSLLILFTAVALRLRGRDQVQRVVYAFVAAGTVSAAYGISQHFGWDPIGFGDDQVRVWSTLLNPIFFGSLLVMTLPITAAAAMWEIVSERPRRWWILLGLALGLQMAALWFTGSRGPLAGIAVGAFVLIAVAAVKLDRTVLLRTLAVSAGGLVLALLLVAIPAGESRGTGSLFGGFAEAGDIGLALSGESQLADGGFTGRAGIWRGGIELATSWETQPAESGGTSFLRPVLGFGPDMYAYSYPLTANARTSIAIGHAHNFLLQILLEMGVAGLITFLAVAVLIMATLIRLLWPGSSERPDLWVTIIAIGLIGALAGRAVEQMGGVARIGDLAPFWILMGLVVALSETIASRPDSPVDSPRASGARPRSRNSSADITVTRLATWAVAIAVVVVAAGTFILQDVQQLRGSRAAVNGERLAANGQATEALLEYQRAIELAPGVSDYPIILFEHVRRVALADDNLPNRQALLELGRDALIEYSERDPFHIRVRERLALAAVNLFTGGREELSEEVIGRYIDLGEAVPSFYDFQSVAANGFLIAGDNELALAAANYSINLEDDGAYAWWVRGVAMNNLGDPDGATTAFERAIAILPESRHTVSAHHSYGDLLENQGRLDEAAEQRALQAELEEQLK